MFIGLTIGGALSVLSCQAAPLKDGGDCSKAAGMPPGVMGTLASPVVMPDGLVTFHLCAPQASNVVVRGSFPNPYEPLTVTMTKDASGRWSGAAGRLAPELYNYNFYIDGVAALDPLNAHTQRDGMRVGNTFIVPGAASGLYAVRDIPHGTVSQVWYPSTSLKLQRRTYVYTPPGYEQGGVRYPVLYLLHGGFGDEDAWSSNGRASPILDNLIAEGRMLPMIVVMPNGNATQRAAPNTEEEYVLQGSFMSMDFADSIVTDLLPFVDRTFRTLPDRSHRAIAGLSMGGAHALWAAFHHLDQFAWVESMSGGYMIIPGGGVEASKPTDPSIPAIFRLPKEIDPVKLIANLPDLTQDANSKLRIFSMTIGEKDRLLPQQRALQAALAAKGINVKATEVAGFSHEWGFWRLALADMLTGLFRPAGPSAR